MVEKSRTDNSLLAAMFMFVILIILVNIVAIVVLVKGRQNRVKMVEGLLKMYLAGILTNIMTNRFSEISTSATTFS